jgi:AcrR family transcriptional regulator
MKTNNPRREAEHERRSAEIMAAAVDLFALKGYEGTTIEDIAASCSYTKGALYYYFKSKEEIFRCLVLSSVDSMEAELDRILAKDLDCEAAVNEIIRDLVKTHLTEKGFFKIYNQTRPILDTILSSEEQSVIKARMAHFFERISSLVREGQKMGVFKPLGEDLGLYLMAMISGIIFHMGSPFLQSSDPAEIADRVLSILLRGVHT